MALLAWLSLAFLLASCASGLDLPLSWDFGVGGEYHVQVDEKLVLTWSGLNHNVQQVTAPFCNSPVRGTLKSSSFSGSVQLDTSVPGTYYYKCGVAAHCGAGMLITVVVDDPPEALPLSPPSPPAEPVPSPPAPLPPGTIIWGFGLAPFVKTVRTGEKVTLQWSGGPPHSVVQKVSDDCRSNTTAILVNATISGTVDLPTRVPGVYYYQCTVSTHCISNGMHMTLIVTPAAPPPPAPPLNLQPGEVLWTFGVRPPVKNVKVGEYLALRWVGPTPHSVVAAVSADCTSQRLAILANTSTAGLVVLPTTTPGIYYYRCGVPGHCFDSMVLTVVVEAVAHSPPGSPPPPMPPLVLGPNDIHWTFGLAPLVKTVIVGTNVTLKWEGTTPHNVLQTDIDNCNTTVIAQLSGVQTSGNVVLPTNIPGTFYYSCGVGSHCAAGGMHFTLVVVTSLSPQLQPSRPPSPKKQPPPKRKPPPKRRRPPPKKHHRTPPCIFRG